MLGAITGGEIPLLILSAFLGCIGLLGTIFWIRMLIDCATREPDIGNTKIVWILIVVFTHFLGALLYLLIRRPQRIRETGR